MLKTVLIVAFLLLVGFLGMQLMAPQSDEPLSSPISQSVSKRTYPPVKSILHSETSTRLKNFRHVLNEANTPLLLLNDKDTNLRLNITPIEIELVSGHQVYFNYVANAVAAEKKAKRSLPARIRVFSTAVLSLNEDWCIDATTETKFKWDGARITNNQKKQAKELLKAHSSTLAKALAGSIDCSKLQNHVQTIWKQRTYKAKLDSKGKSIEVAIHPTNIGYTELKLESGRAIISFQTDAIASTQDYEGKMTKLPGARKLSKQGSELRFSMPLVNHPYTAIENSLKAKLVNAPLTSRTKYGTFSFTIHSLKLFPYGQSLALALFIEASNTEEWFSKKGWVYLTLVPKIENDGNVLGLSLKGFSDGIEPSLALGLKNTVSQELKHLVIKNFKQDLGKLKLALKPVLAEDNEGVMMKLTQTKMQLGNISLADQHLQADGIFSAGADLVSKADVEESIPHFIEIKPIKPIKPISGEGGENKTAPVSAADSPPKIVKPLKPSAPVAPESNEVLPMGISR